MQTPTEPQSITARLWKLALPIIGLNVLNVLALAVDTAMCGRLPNAEVALTALGFSTQVVFLLMVGMIGLTVGTVAFVARAYGAKQSERVNHILHQSTMLTILLGIIVALFGNLIAPPILTLLGAEGEVLVSALDYLRPLLAGVVFSYLSILYGAVWRGVGNTRLPFVIALISNVLNVLFNYGLILGNYGLPSLGVQGAAIGTVLSQAVGVAVMVFLLQRPNSANLLLPLRPALIDTQLSKDLIRIGAPAALDMIILNAGFMVIVGLLGNISQVSVAAHGIGLRIQALAFVPGLGVSQATAAMVGQALGANDSELARKIVRISVVMTTSIMTLLAIFIIAGVEPIVSGFDVDPATPLGEYSILWIKILGYGMPFVGVYIAFAGMLQGSGATRTSLAINTLATLMFQIPLAAILGLGFELGAFGVWVSLPIAFVAKSLLGFGAYKQGKWAKIGSRA